MGQRFGAAMLAIFIAGAGVGVAGIRRDRLAKVANHVRQRQLLPQQQMQGKPEGQQQRGPAPAHAVRVLQAAHSPRKSKSIWLRRKPRGSFGGGGGSALRQNTPPQSVQRKCT